MDFFSLKCLNTFWGQNRWVQSYRYGLKATDYYLKSAINCRTVAQCVEVDKIYACACISVCVVCWGVVCSSVWRGLLSLWLILWIPLASVCGTWKGLQMLKRPRIPSGSSNTGLLCFSSLNLVFIAFINAHASWSLWAPYCMNCVTEHNAAEIVFFLAIWSSQRRIFIFARIIPQTILTWEQISIQTESK